MHALYSLLGELLASVSTGIRGHEMFISLFLDVSSVHAFLLLQQSDTVLFPHESHVTESSRGSLPAIRGPRDTDSGAPVFWAIVLRRVGKPGPGHTQGHGGLKGLWGGCCAAGQGAPGCLRLEGRSSRPCLHPHNAMDHPYILALIHVFTACRVL